LGLSRWVSIWVLAGLAGLAGLGVLHVWHPTDDPRGSICLFRRVSGVPCPGCGMTRAFAHLAKGEWREAARDHPLSFLVAPELALAWLAWGLSLAGRRVSAAGGIGGHRLEGVLLANAGLLVALWLGRLATGTLPG
jgi:hypothetical protein